jgi:hypothetical protein
MQERAQDIENFYFAPDSVCWAKHIFKKIYHLNSLLIAAWCRRPHNTIKSEFEGSVAKPPDNILLPNFERLNYDAQLGPVPVRFSGDGGDGFICSVLTMLRRLPLTMNFIFIVNNPPINVIESVAYCIILHETSINILII